MDPTSLYEDSNWSDIDDDSDNDNSELFSSPGYVSLGSVQHNHAQAPSWAADEIIQRSNTYATAPKYYNQKKNKSPTKQRTKMNNKEYASLFPFIDVLIWYLPTYILRNRSCKCKHYTFLTICILCVLMTIYNQSQTVQITYFDKKQPTYNITRGVFYSILYLNPYIGSCLRFYFFYCKFDWSLWYKKKKRTDTSLNDATTSSISYTLSQSPRFKARLRLIIHGSCLLLSLIMLIKYVYAIAFWCDIVLLDIDNEFELKHSEWAVSISIIMVQSLIFIISISIPDLLMAIVARIYFTECYLYIKSFINDMELDDIIDGNICDGYCEMHKKIDGYKNMFRLWILNLLLQMVMASWHTLSMYIHQNHVEYTQTWLIYSAIEALIYLIEVVFVLYPAMLMTEKINTLNQVINEKINDILQTRLHFHDDLILANLMKAIAQKQQMFMHYNMNIGDEMKSMDNTVVGEHKNESIVSSYNEYQDKGSSLWNSITTHSKEEYALEILNRLKYLSKKNSCRYVLFGVQIDRSIITHFIIALIVTNVLSFMCESFDAI